jgi:hypothetical protein
LSTVKANGAPRLGEALRSAVETAMAGLRGVSRDRRQHAAESVVAQVLLLRVLAGMGWLDGRHKRGEDQVEPVLCRMLLRQRPRSGQLDRLFGLALRELGGQGVGHLRLATNTVERVLDHLRPFSVTVDRPGFGNLSEVLAQDAIGCGYEEMVSERHGKGAYYTEPAEAVFMGRESLRCYLETQCPEVECHLVAGVLHGKVSDGSGVLGLTDEAAGRLLDALSRVTVCDPAMGAGTFVVTMLRLVCACMTDLASHLALVAGRTEHVPTRVHGTRVLQLKLQILRRSLFGCDVDALAVSIAKLRLWSDLIAGTRSPFALPDLEENLRTGDALMGSTDESPSVADAHRPTAHLRWAGAFTSVFQRENRGFDIVITNPPYVRQELIDHALQASGLPLTKRQLLAEYRTAFGDAVNGKSDLYAYFMLRCYFLLRERGVLCVLTSNSWLDVEFGVGLQEFMAGNSDIVAIYENVARRSFAAADVNTVIGVFRRTGGRGRSAHQVRFVSLRTPFENVGCHTHARLWSVRESVEDETFKVVVRRQSSIRSAVGRWGSTYLRAPEVYSTILERAAGKLLRLDRVADVSRGFTSGANEFFYVDPDTVERWGIEDEFLVPFLFSLKEVDGYVIDGRASARRLFHCSLDTTELRRRGKGGALSYIAWGEKQGFHRRPSVRARSVWYCVPEQGYPDFVSNRFLGRRFGFPRVVSTLVGDVFFVGSFRGSASILDHALINSTLTYLSAEVLSRKTYGIGVAYLYGPETRELLVADKRALTKRHVGRITDAFGAISRRRLLNVGDEVRQDDRRELDEAVFDALGLDRGIREVVYEALVGLVESRLSKARSLDAGA